jgi:hypothetical protein
MAHKPTVKLFDLWRQEPANVEGFFRLMEESGGAHRAMKFRDACVKVGVPYTLMYGLVRADPVLKARYEALRAANAELLVHAALDAAEGAEDKDSAAVAKVQADTYLRVAASWDKEVYGEHVQVSKSVTVTVDAGLVGRAAELLEKVGGRVLEHEPAPRELAE